MQDDARARLLAKDRIGHRHHADLANLAEAEDQIFDLIAADFLPAAIDQILPPTFRVTYRPRFRTMSPIR